MKYVVLYSCCLIALLVLAGCDPAGDDGGYPSGPVTFSVSLDNPKALFINDAGAAGFSFSPDSSGGRSASLVSMRESELYQITGDDLIEAMEIETEGDVELLADVGAVLKLSDRYFVIRLETWSAEDVNDMSLYNNYTLVIDRSDGSIVDLGSDYGMFDWTSQLNDEPLVIDQEFYTVEGGTLYRIDLAEETVTPLNNPDAVHVGAFVYLTDGYILASVLVGPDWKYCLLSDSLVLPKFLDSDPNVSYIHMAELVQNHYETFSPLNDADNDLFDVEISYDSGNNLARLFGFGLTAGNDLTVDIQDIRNFTGTPESYFSCANSATTTDRFRMLVLQFGFVYVESNEPAAGFSFSSGQKDLGFLFDAYGGPVFEFYDSATKAVWKNSADSFCIFDIINDDVEADAEEITVSGLTAVYATGSKIVYTRMFSATEVRTYEYNPAGDDILLLESEMLPASVVEF
jgi:hypothetical protein